MTEPGPAGLLAPGTEPVWREAATWRGAPDAAAVMRIRRDNPGVSPEIVAGILTQTALRRRARPAFGGLADRMLFTSAGLQQSTRPVVAARRARLAADAGVRSIQDLGCGIGVDAMAFQRAGLEIVAVESDPATAAVAQHNLGEPVLVADFTSSTVPAADATFLDPARRAQGRRLLAPEQWQPRWSWILRHVAEHPATCVKASPGFPHELIPHGATAEWTSVAGALVETCIWFPGIATGVPDRRAVLIAPGGDPWHPAAVLELAADGTTAQAHTGPIGDLLLEPDPAIIRSHLIGVLADRLGARLVSDGIAYLTLDHPPEQPWGQCFRITDSLPAGGKALRLELRRRGIGRVEIHTRGLGIDPMVLRKSLRLSGSGPVQQLVLTRTAGRPSGFLVEQLPPPTG